MRQYAEALGVSRQAANARLQRFVELGLLTVARSELPVSFADLAKRNMPVAPAVHVYRVKGGAA